MLLIAQIDGVWKVTVKIDGPHQFLFKPLTTDGIFGIAFLNDHVPAFRIFTNHRGRKNCRHMLNACATDAIKSDDQTTLLSSYSKCQFPLCWICSQIKGVGNINRNIMLCGKDIVGGIIADTIDIP